LTVEAISLITDWLHAIIELGDHVETCWLDSRLWTQCYDKDKSDVGDRNCGFEPGITVALTLSLASKTHGLGLEHADLEPW